MAAPIAIICQAIDSSDGGRDLGDLMPIIGRRTRHCGRCAAGLRLLENLCGFRALVVLRGFYGNARHKACESNKADRYHVMAAPPLMHRKGHAGSGDQQRHQDDHGFGRCRFTCAPSASRDHADERAFHLLLNALHRASADAALTRDLAHALAGAQLRLDALFKGSIDPRPTELLALRHGALEASMNTLPDHAALKLGKRTADLKHELACRGGRVDRLLIEVQIDAAGLQRLDRAQQIDQRAAQPVDRPGHDHVKLAPLRIIEHLVEAWTPVTALGTTDASVVILLDHLPTSPLGDLAQGGDLVIDGLLVGGYADVNCGALLHDGPPMLSGPYHSCVPKALVFWTCARAKKHH